MDQRAKAQAFRRFHLEPPILVLPNAWDVASAKHLAGLPGCRALATTSAAVARALGWEDGEQAPADEMIEANRRIAAAVDGPVTGGPRRGDGDRGGGAGDGRPRARVRRPGRPRTAGVGAGSRRDQLRGLDP